MPLTFNSNTSASPRLTFNGGQGSSPKLSFNGNLAPANPSYFYNKFPSGATLGRSDQLDASGKPFLGYRNPGDHATSTDMTRTATTFNPTTPSIQDAQTFKTPRLVNDRAQVKSSLGGSYSDELDHQISLELAGSNDKSNLAIQPGRINGQAKESDNLETHLAREVASGKMSLFDAQSQLAKSKGTKTPWTPLQNKETPFDATPLGIAKNTITGLPKAAWDITKGVTDNVVNRFTNSPAIKALEQSVVQKSFNPLKDYSHQLDVEHGFLPKEGESISDQNKRLYNSAQDLAMGFMGGEGGDGLAKGILSESAIKKIPEAIREEAVNLYNALKKIGSSGKPNIELEGKVNDFMTKVEKGVVKPIDLMDAREAHFQAKGNQSIPLKATSPADRLIAEGKIKVQSINNRDTYFYKDPKGEWKRSIGEDNAVRMATKPTSALPQDLVERKTALEIQKDEMKNNPLNNLTKYQARRGEFKGQLPEVTGNSKGTFGKKGDTILTEHLGNIDSEAARAKYEKFTENKARLAEEEASLKQDIQNHKNSLKFSREGIPLAKTKIQNRIAQEASDSRLSQPKSLREPTAQINSGKASSPKYTEIPTKNKVEYKITGNTGKERVESAVANFERAKNELSIKGKSAYTLGRKFGNPELKVFRDKYQAGVPIDEIASKSSNPVQAKKYLNEVKDYYDLQLAHDRAAGGQTANEPNHLTQSWNLDNPKDLARFNELATQKGLQPYNGFHAQPKVFKTYAEGEAAGFKPKNANMNEDLLKHSQQASNVISKQVLKKSLAQAAPRDVSMQGAGMTKEGKPFVNSNIKGLEGISYHPSIHSQLKGFEPLKNQDVFSLMKDKGFDASKPSTYKKAWEGLKEGGVLNTVSTLYDRSTTSMKHLLLNFSGFHSINVSSNFTGASIFHPLQGAKGLASSIPSFFSEKITQGIIDGMKSKLVKGQDFSVFDAGLRSGVNMDRGLPAKGLAKLNPMSALGRAMFDRELHTLKLNLVDQVFGSGKVLPESVKGRAFGKEINLIMGEMNNRTMNINPNTQKWLSRALLAPQFTESKYKLIGDALTKSGQNGGNLARTAVIGKTIAMGTIATLGTVLATGKFPNLQQILLNYSLNPSSQTNMTNSKGQKQDISYPKTFVTEPASAISDPIHYAESRLSPVASDVISIGTNKDYYGNPVYDKNKPESALSQYGKNVGLGDLPIGVQSVIKQAQGKQTGAETALQIAGLRTHISPNDQNVQETNDANQLAQEEKDTRAKLRNDAKAQVATIDALPEGERQAALDKIAASDMNLAKEIVKVKSQKDLGFTSKDYAIGSLGVLDGARARFISDQMKKMPSRDEREKYWNELVGKKLITAKVAQEINEIMK